MSESFDFPHLAILDRDAVDCRSHMVYRNHQSTMRFGLQRRHWSAHFDLEAVSVCEERIRRAAQLTPPLGRLPSQLRVSCRKQLQHQRQHPPLPQPKQRQAAPAPQPTMQQPPPLRPHMPQSQRCFLTPSPRQRPLLPRPSPPQRREASAPRPRPQLYLPHDPLPRQLRPWLLRPQLTPPQSRLPTPLHLGHLRR